ncbi:putative secreted protein (Por secretion system target) [Mariniflexile fucanivorans]|uniref:Putative secreted protein (Por secretion system target) n=1 Tax=Mariniflexile fucanivorans TaxID=264023 RepID=A0A4R1RA74_9FLAO|nr:T9SS type A sorting domain-containing protein [Mariniflexile fucanivorans]TCL62490.1 putative secreted protein (Por secretion system target) [Mariniflexile fucanivorans]
MKKIILTIFILTSCATFSQITFEHTYSTTGFSDNKGFFFNTDNASYHYTLDNINNEMHIYTETHSLYKTVNLPVDLGSEVTTVLFATDKLFNNDSLIEFIIITETPYDPISGITYKMTILNENSIVIQQLGNREIAYIVKTNSNNYKLITMVGTDANPSNPLSTVDVYSLAGTLSVNQVGLLSKKIKSYPNPTENLINITNPLNSNESATLSVFSVNGQLVLEKKVFENEKLIQLDVSSLPNGLYLYKINDYSNKFIKE